MQARFCSSIRLEMANKMVKAIIFKISKNMRFHFPNVFNYHFAALNSSSNWVFLVISLLELVMKFSWAITRKRSYEGKVFINFFNYTITLIKDEKSVKSWLEYLWEDHLLLPEKSLWIALRMQSCGGIASRNATISVTTTVAIILWFTKWKNNYFPRCVQTFFLGSKWLNKPTKWNRE